MDSDREALVDFKNGLHDPENRLSSWKGSNCCQWWGISCETTSGAVIAVDLHNPYPNNYDESTGTSGFWNLSGEIRPSLTKLKFLRLLDLSFNTFDGNTIPQFFGSLKNLQYLNLSNSGGIYILGGGNYEIVGSYYESFVVNMKGQPLRYTKTLSLVTALDLSGNNLSGDLPIEITNLLGLLVLDLSSNQITGHIPESISKLKELLSLDLSSNRFSGAIPQSLGSLSSLGYLNLSNNELSGPIPDKDQMLTFNASSFAGNVGLCGRQLAVKCPVLPVGEGEKLHHIFKEKAKRFSMSA
ncbi:hypothetical protein FEM48_Zijuj05G0019300 [Ziziphus jujuba var. spinosa]|uniref:Leucine-rich repeat-containing N-terminal plant-type domain-containing protein n=1 Tax=Ziziphus jujuba var. spinosa TaxID=714518 RepID=A0A978VC50_ZIZJJ|nr:hypothetical protein FEM48_Zijuj05G0019300 [Ziziphus jujuba var. spinosa]